MFQLLLLVVCLGGQSHPAAAQSLSAYDVIDGVNALRASQGLAPYTVDSSLMSYAQQHSDYCASNNFSTHLHSDGQYPWNIGIQENVAVGTSGMMTADFIINQIWADAVHMKTMTGYTAGYIGVGVALGSGMDYITLDVRPGSSPATDTPAGGGAAAANQPAGTPMLPTPLVTSTPRPDGSVVHVVGYGQTLWSIALAYGVKIDQIRAFNNIAAGSTSIYVGQKLLIYLAGTMMLTQTSTPTQTPTATRTPSRTSLPPTATRTLTPTVAVSPSPTLTFTPISQRSLLSLQGSHVVGLALIIICAVGPLLVLFLPRLRK
jgi:uncharacterized protein YkwD